MKTESPKRKSSSSKGTLQTRLLRWSRKVHLWTGVALAVFVLDIALTGLFLLHEKELDGIGSLQVPPVLLPGHYSAQPGEAGKAALRDVIVSPANPDHWLVLGREEAFISVDRGRGLAPIAPDAAIEKPHAGAFGGQALWLGHKAGLAACALDGSECRAVALPPEAEGEPHVTALAVSGPGVAPEELIIATHHGLLYSSSDQAQSWVELAGLEAAGAGSGGDVRVHALAWQQGHLLAATKNGLFGRDAGGAWRAQGLRGRDVWDIEVAPGALWASIKHHPESSDDARLLVSTDDGVGWRKFAAPLLAPLAAAEAKGPADKLELALAPALDLAAGGVLLVAPAAVARFGLDTSEVTLGSAISLPARASDAVPLKKVLNDLHTGKFFNHQLWLVYDIGALALVLFVLTGLHLWAMPILMRRQKEARRNAPPAAVAVKS